MSLKPGNVAATVAMLGLSLVSGCLPWGRPADLRKGTESILDRSVSPAGSGKIIAPKRNTLKTAIIARPARDPAITDKLWAAADEQFLPAETRRVLEANGVRVGVISGSLPLETEAVMNEPPPDRVDPVTIDMPDGDPTQVQLITAADPVTLLLTQDGRTFGKDYADAKGMLRLTAHQDGSGGISVKITPEIHYGPVTKGFAATPQTDAYAPREFMVKTGQQEENFRELSTEVKLKPGQIVVVGGRSDAGRDIGAFLFTEAEKNSDRVKQKVLLIWASPGGTLGALAAAKDAIPQPTVKP